MKQSSRFESEEDPLLKMIGDMQSNFTHPYLEMVMKNAISVRVNPVESSHYISMAIAKYSKHESIAPSQCYFHSFNIIKLCNSRDLRYVEGLSLDENGRILSHAWISFQGKYYDPWQEAASIYSEKVHGVKFENPFFVRYVKLMEFSLGDFRQYFGKRVAPWLGKDPINPPYAPIVFNLKHRFDDQYNFCDTQKSLEVRLRMMGDD